MKTTVSLIASKNLDIKCDGGTEKIRRRRDWSLDNFDAMEIRLGRPKSKSTKFDGAGVWSYMR